MVKILRVIPFLDPHKGGLSEGIRQLQHEIQRHGLMTKFDIVCMNY